MEFKLHSLERILRLPLGLVFSLLLFGALPALASGPSSSIDKQLEARGWRPVKIGDFAVVSLPESHTLKTTPQGVVVNLSRLGAAVVAFGHPYTSKTEIKNGLATLLGQGARLTSKKTTEGHATGWRAETKSGGQIGRAFITNADENRPGIVVAVYVAGSKWTKDAEAIRTRVVKGAAFAPRRLFEIPQGDFRLIGALPPGFEPMPSDKNILMAKSADAQILTASVDAKRVDVVLKELMQMRPTKAEQLSPILAQLYWKTKDGTLTTLVAALGTNATMRVGLFVSQTDLSPKDIRERATGYVAHFTAAAVLESPQLRSLKKSFSNLRLKKSSAAASGYVPYNDTYFSTRRHFYSFCNGTYSSTLRAESSSPLHTSSKTTSEAGTFELVDDDGGVRLVFHPKGEKSYSFPIKRQKQDYAVGSKLWFPAGRGCR